MKNQTQKAEEFRELHRRKKLLILPNAWDVPSARIFEDEGFPAIATSSAGVMVSLGYPDGEVIDRKSFVAATQRIASALSVPLSADIVSGFGATPRDVMTTVKSVLKAGAVGINIEDFDHASGKLVPLKRQVEKLKALGALRDSQRVPFVINARTDALRHAIGNERARLEEAIRRGIAYQNTQADCIYPMGLTNAASIETFVRALDCPVNVMVRPGLPSLAELERLGVKRLSLGPSASYAALGLLRRASRELLERGTYATLLDGAINFDELNRLAVPKR